MENLKNIYLIIPAGGSGKRMNSPIPKQFIEIDNVPIIIHTLRKFDKIKEINKIIISIAPEITEELKSYIHNFNIITPTYYVANGEFRHISVYNALVSEHCNNADYVLIHDAVRPNISSNLIHNIINSLSQYDSVIPVVPAKDTIKEVDKDNFIIRTLNREILRQVQTPQAFKYDIILKAYNQAITQNAIFTDDSAIAELAGEKVKAILGEESNIKITTTEDLKSIK